MVSLVNETTTIEEEQLSGDYLQQRKNVQIPLVPKIEEGGSFPRSHILPNIRLETQSLE
jgi:hypothetical protein